MEIEFYARQKNTTIAVGNTASEALQKVLADNPKIRTIELIEYRDGAHKLCIGLYNKTFQEHTGEKPYLRKKFTSRAQMEQFIASEAIPCQ